jgi:DNA-binding winged helix-turn-helix (wHTH) protein/Tol biopolymer transport system component
METGELKKHGVRVRLQHKPFQILSALLERPGHLITREELRAKLWPSDVFVDFESGLNTAMNRLRISLGDSVDNPVYIETLARLGYRFLAPVEVMHEEPGPAPVRPPGLQTGPLPELVRQTASEELQQKRRFRFRPSGWVIAVGIVGLVTMAALAITYRRSEPVFEQLTFRKGLVTNARFTPDGKHVIYSAEWNGAPSRVFFTSTEHQETKALNFDTAKLVGIASRSEFGVSVPIKNGEATLLETVSLDGSAPRIVSEDTTQVDWGPNGALCVVRAAGSRYVVEYPAGHKLYESSNWIDDVRVSPNGGQVAFAEHPVPRDDAGQVVVADAGSGHSKVLSAGWESLDGLAWHPSGKEVWFTAAQSGVERNLMAVSLEGKTRLVARSPGGLQLRDIARSGEVLVNRSNARMSMLSGTVPQTSEKDISWLDWSVPAGISADGNTILFSESGAGGGTGYSVFIYRRGSQSPEKIGSGRALDLSDDGRWVLTQNASDPSTLTLISVETKMSSAVPTQGFNYRWCKFFPNAREILVAGNFTGKPSGIYRQTLPGGTPAFIESSAQFEGPVIDPEGRFAIGASGKSRELTILDLSDGRTRTIEPNKMVYPVVFVNKNQILTRRPDGEAAVLELMDIKTGAMKSFRRLEFSDPAGVARRSAVMLARNLESYVYSRFESYSNLFAVSGLH